ncbi:questin oxidase family protein [Glycomyces tenuis]|uniref:questin oxidase family protein n=1 Tax=Glycomyces tenuis TaxID=58116 RepID=UPI001B7F8CBA|nr:questin oxidase family protein [Glycomyces tenuis]
MAVEVMVRRGLDIDVEGWVDGYAHRLAELPRPNETIHGNEFRSALGAAHRLPDWTAFFRHELRERLWSEVLVEWWPRLLPGIIAGSTHGVIRVGHAVRAIRTGTDAAPNIETLDELAHGLAFWAARYRELAGVTSLGGRLSPTQALNGIARLDDQSGLIAHRLNRLERDPRWASSLRALRPVATADEVPARLEALIDTAVAAYLEFGHASPVLLVHAATAPNAVRQVLPVLPSRQWVPSLTAVWTAAAAIMAAYAPSEPTSRVDVVDSVGPLSPLDALQRAAEHGDEHVLKFADTAVDAYDRTGDSDLLAATVHAGRLLPPFGEGGR